MKKMQIAAFLMFCTAGMLAAQQAPDNLQFNVPYLCSDGYTYVVHKCTPGAKGEVCTFQIGDESERYNTRAAVAYQITNKCKLKSPGATGGASSISAAQQSSGLLLNTPYQCSGNATITLTQCQQMGGRDFCTVKLELNGQFVMQIPKPKADIEQELRERQCKAGATINPPYLTQFPPKDVVVQGMKVQAPRETVIRSMGALYQLSEIIQTLAQAHGGALTADEKKLIDQYSAEITNLQQAAAKNLNGEQLTLAANPYHFNRSDPRFGFEGIPVWVSFLSPTLQAQFAQLVGGNNPEYMAKIQQLRQRAIDDANAQQKALIAKAQEQAAELAMPKDAGSVAMRKCLESGRSDTECLGVGMKTGLSDLMGGNPLKGIVPEASPGLRLSGTYSAGNLRLSFDESAAVMKCGSLEPASYPYSIERSGAQVMVKVPVSPKPLQFTYSLDGRLSGPGMVDIAGLVPVGGAVANTSTSYEAQTQTTMQTRQIDAAETRNYEGTDAVHQNGMEYSVNEPVTSTSYAPVHHTTYSVPMKSKIEKCNAGVLPPTGSNVKVSDALTQLLGTQASKAANTTPGLRMAGTYSGPGGFSIEFRDDSATVECGAAHNAEAYSVVRSGGQFEVKMQNGGAPFTLLLQSNGALVGSGTVAVEGRKLVPTADRDPHNFVPVKASCTLGTLVAKSE
jgi:hypothetical protein